MLIAESWLSSTTRMRSADAARAAPRRRARRAGATVSVSASTRQQRQAHRELAAAAGAFAARFDDAAVHFHESAHDDETDAEPAVRAAVQALLVRRGLEQTRHRLRSRCRGRCRSRVMSAWPATSSAASRSIASSMRPAFVGVLRRVREQVADDLRQPAPRRLRRAAGYSGSAIVSSCRRDSIERPHGFERELRDFAQLDRLLLQRQLAARDARDVEQIVDQPREVPVLPRDHVARPLELRDPRSLLRCMSSIEPWIAASGLRSSCESIARKSSLRRSAASSACCARSRSTICSCSVALASASSAFACASVALSASSSRAFSACSAAFAAGEALVEPLELAPLAVELDQHLHLAAQDLRHDRHVDVIDGAELVALQPVEVGHVHRGDEDDRRLLEARMLVDQRRGLEAVHARHVDVEQDRREVALHQPRERLRARSARARGSGRARPGSRRSSSAAPAGRRRAGR